jgi:hypothetical protein
MLVHLTMDGKDDHFTETGSAKRANAEQRSVLTPKRKSVFEFPLSVSRACLGKMIIFIYKWLLKSVFVFTRSDPKERQIINAMVNIMDEVRAKKLSF